MASQKSLGGAIAGLIGGESADDKLRQVPYWKRYEPALNAIIKGISGRQYQDALNKYTAATEAYAPTAQANVAKYNEQFQNLFNDQYSPMADYERIRAGNIGSLGDYAKNVLDYNLARIKGQLVDAGRGDTGPSSFDRILNATVTASNIAPVLNTIYSNLGRDTSLMAGANSDRLNRQLGLLASDYLNAPADAAAQRSFLPFLAQRQLQGVDLDLLGRAGELQRGNVAGFRTVPGLSSRLDDFAQATMNAAQFAGSFMGGGAGGGLGGLGGLMGGGTQTASTAPSTNFLQNSYFQPSQVPSYAPAMQSLYPATANTYSAAPSNAFLNWNPNSLGLNEYRAPALY